MAVADFEIKFRLADGSDIGPKNYASSCTVECLKNEIIQHWPKVNGPKTIKDLKLISAGKVLENNKTLAEFKSPIPEVTGAITMHVVVQPPLLDKNSDKLHGETPIKGGCSCSIL